MFEKVKALRLQYREAQSEAEEQAIQQTLDSLRAEELSKFPDHLLKFFR